MKKIKQFGKIAFLALALTFASCSSDSEGTPVTNGAEGTITAKVDGNTFTTSVIATGGTISGGNQYTLLSIFGTELTSRGITLQIIDFAGVGTYTVGSETGPHSICGYSDKKPGSTNEYETWTTANATDATGSITITEKSESNIKGTFSFKGKNAITGTYKELTNGSFNLKMSQITTN